MTDKRCINMELDEDRLKINFEANVGDIIYMHSRLSAEVLKLVMDNSNMSLEQAKEVVMTSAQMGVDDFDDAD